VANKRASADHLLTIRRKRRPTPGRWVGLKPTDDLLAMYAENGCLQFIFDSSIEADLEIPEGPEHKPIRAADLKPLPGEPYDTDSPGLTYFIGGDVGAIKIGRSVNVTVRLKDIQACSPIPVRVLATREGVARERLYHRKFAHRRLHGEWFKRCPEIEAEIERLSNG
jgi:hypothetical protein